MLDVDAAHPPTAVTEIDTVEPEFTSAVPAVGLHVVPLKVSVTPEIWVPAVPVLVTVIVPAVMRWLIETETTDTFAVAEPEPRIPNT